MVKLNDIKCITMNNDEFEILCLNRLLLETVSVRHHQCHKKLQRIIKLQHSNKFYNQKYALKKKKFSCKNLMHMCTPSSRIFYIIRSFIMKMKQKILVSENILSIRHVQIIIGTSYKQTLSLFY